MSARFTSDQIDEWSREGAVLIPDFFTADEIAPCRADFEQLYGTTGEADGGQPRTANHGAGVGSFAHEQFTHVEDFPLNCSPAANMIALHPAVIALARAALGTENVHLYQCHSWAKFTGDADYDQPFHCDYKNHTLTVPAEDHGLQTINMVFYFTDVTDAHGAIHYVPQSLSDPITGPDRPMFLESRPDLQRQLMAKELSGAAPAGALFAYGIDIFHRGTNLTAPNGYRYTMTVSYKAAGNDMIGWIGWPRTFLKPWHLIFDNANADQLACLGVPKPGNSFWTERTVSRAQERWPGWNMDEYRAAL